MGYERVWTSEHASFVREIEACQVSGSYHVLEVGMIRKVNYHFITGVACWLQHESDDVDKHLYTDPGCTCTSPLADDWFEKCSQCRFNKRYVEWDELAEVIEVAGPRSSNAKVRLQKDGMEGWMSVFALKPVDFPNMKESDWHR